MFELNQALRKWRQSLSGCNGLRQADVEELEDHLRCEIEALTYQGLSAERAFELATETMGDPAILAAEYQVNQHPVTRTVRSALQRVYRMEKNSMKAARSSTLMIGSSLVWAAMMIACSLILRGSEHASDIFFILLSGWFATFFLLQPSSKATIRAEWACLKRMVAPSRKS